MMYSLAACILGFGLDVLLGDPHWMWFHPIRLIGNTIAFLEKKLRKPEDSATRQIISGAVLVVLVTTLAFVLPYGILFLCRQVHPLLALVVESILCYFLFAAKSLKVESMKVYEALEQQGLPSARKAVSMIVGRDVDSLDEEGVAKAAIETVAENTSDGVIAPMLYMMLGGAPLGFLYKAINTMDSMIGYKNDKYLYFGRVAAKTDDVANYVPARISALLMLLGAYLIPECDGRNAGKIYKRDRKKSESPNASQTEAVCAGALQIQLLGDAYYFGKLHKKESIGDKIQPVTPEKIVEVNRLMYATTLLGMVAMLGIKSAVILWIQGA